MCRRLGLLPRAGGGLERADVVCSRQARARAHQAEEGTATLVGAAQLQQRWAQAVAQRAAAAGVPNAQFVVGNAAEWLRTAATDGLPPRVDVVTALHACGGLSDVALVSPTAFLLPECRERCSVSRCPVVASSLYINPVQSVPMQQNLFLHCSAVQGSRTTCWK